MNWICWRLVEVVSRVLETAERDVVRGDIAESRETSVRALRDMLGLAARRQLALWYDWRPWLVLTGLVIPVGLLLSLVSHSVAKANSVYLWMYLNNWDWALLEHRAFWIILGQTIVSVSPDILALIGLAWAIGFAVGDLSRRTIPVNGALFGLVSVLAALLVAPQYFRLQLRFFMLGVHLHGTDPDPVSSIEFYRVMLPVLVQVVLVFFPALVGMYQGFGRWSQPLVFRVMVWGPAIASMLELAARQVVWAVSMARHERPWLAMWQHPPLLVGVAGPIIYWMASWKRRYTARESPG